MRVLLAFYAVLVLSVAGAVLAASPPPRSPPPRPSPPRPSRPPPPSPRPPPPRPPPPRPPPPPSPPPRPPLNLELDGLMSSVSTTNAALSDNVAALARRVDAAIVGNASRLEEMIGALQAQVAALMTPCDPVHATGMNFSAGAWRCVCAYGWSGASCNEVGERLPPTTTQFTSVGSSSFTAPQSAYARVLIVGGGGGGGAYIGGGGGGGGVVYYDRVWLDAGTYAVTVGAGAAALSFQRGRPSSFEGLAVAQGGGYGAEGGGQTVAYHIYDATGGSGGGSGGGGGSAPGLQAGRPGTAGQGYPGGTATSDCYNAPIGHCASGGGGGAGGAGQNVTLDATAGGDGGVGLAVNITGAWAYYGGGGGGASAAFFVAGDPPCLCQGGLGGLGGGGNGTVYSSGAGLLTPGGSGAPNTGGGGGGGGAPPPWNPFFAPATTAGGSGVVIVVFPVF